VAHDSFDSPPTYSTLPDKAPSPPPFPHGGRTPQYSPSPHEVKLQNAYRSEKRPSFASSCVRIGCHRSRRTRHRRRIACVGSCIRTNRRGNGPARAAASTTAPTSAPSGDRVGATAPTHPIKARDGPGRPHPPRRHFLPHRSVGSRTYRFRRGSGRG